LTRVVSTSSRLHRIVVLIWVAFFLRGAFYASILPVWEGFDEYAHFAFIHHLKTFGTLPRKDELVSAEISRSLKLVPLPWSLNKWQFPATTHDAFWKLSPVERLAREDAFANLPPALQSVREGEFVEEAKQPPLYYLLSMAVLKVAASSSLPTRVLVLRLFSILLASLVIPLSFAVSRRVLGETHALSATILIASMPGLLIAISRVANDSLAIALFAALTYALVRSEPWDNRGALLIGTIFGAGLLTKAYFVAALPAVLWSGAAAFLRLPVQKRTGCFARVAASLGLALVLSGWWYVRTLGGGGPVWNDAAPLTPLVAGDLWRYALAMDWWEAAKVSLNAHLWVGGWSFLGVRSWMYDLLRGIFLIALTGGFLRMLRSTPRFSALWFLYGGFWGALLYHAFVNFINVGIPASTGWYLYAVVVCEGVLLCSAAQWLGPRWQGYATASLTGLLLLLECYATHFVLIPYYIGLTSHNAEGGLAAFHISQATNLGLQGILSRVVINKPAFVIPAVVVMLWLAFAFASIYLLVMACRYARASGT
jgi:hypothetical protein